MLTKMVIGDYSNDGHGRTKSFVIEHNLDSHTDLVAAHERASNQLDVHLDEHLENFDETALPAFVVHHLQDMGVLPKNLDDTRLIYADDDQQHTYFVGGSSEYMELWLKIAQHAVPTLTYQIVDVPTVDIGGYSLV